GEALQPLTQLRLQHFAGSGRARLQGGALQHGGFGAGPVARLLQVDASDHRSEIRPQASGGEAQAVAGRLRRLAGQGDQLTAPR
ncbi:MAG: hypothetical protein ACK55I_44595, partial [bacterium]